MDHNPGFQRLFTLTGTKAADAITGTKIMVFGLGGVGSWCAEALARSGAGKITLVDHDKVEISNINRQAQATINTIGQQKTAALSARLKEINPDCEIIGIPEFFSSETEPEFDISSADYIIDAIDSLESKLDLIEAAASHNKTIYSSMGMACRLDPQKLRTCDIWKTAGCPLARRVREGLRKRGFTGNFTVVFSDENIICGPEQIKGSAVTVTAAAGLILASLVIRDICKRADTIVK